MWELLNSIKAALEAIPELKSVDIGAEMGINAGVTPAARIVLERRTANISRAYIDEGDLYILLLLDLKNDLPKVYEDSIALEEKIRDAVKAIIYFNETLYDSDTTTSFKATMIRFGFRKIDNTRSVTGCG